MDFKNIQYAREDFLRSKKTCGSSRATIEYIDMAFPKLCSTLKAYIESTIRAIVWDFANPTSEPGRFLFWNNLDDHPDFYILSLDEDVRRVCEEYYSEVFKRHTYPMTKILSLKIRNTKERRGGKKEKNQRLILIITARREED